MSARLRLAFAAAAVVVASLATAIGPATAQRPTNLSYAVVARADAMAVEVRNPSFPLVSDGVVAFAAPATSQALISSAGESRAFASAPYAGDFVVNLPGTVNGLSGGQFPPLPTYPFIVTSNYPLEPAEDEVVGPYGISAASGATRSDADARVGVITGATDLLANHAIASASIDPATSTATARAVARVETFSVGPLLRIGAIETSVTLTRTADGELDPDTDFAVGTITIAGIEVGVTEDGLSLDTTALPLVGIESLLDQLSAAGLGVRVIPSEVTDNGIISAGLEVTYSIDVPGQGLVQVILTFGRVSATAQVNSITAPAPVAAAPPAPEPAPATPRAPLETPASTPPGPAGGGVPAAATPMAPANVPVADLGAVGRELRLISFYLALVLAAVSVLVGSRAFALGGVTRRIRPDPRLIPPARHVLDLFHP